MHTLLIRVLAFSCFLLLFGLGAHSQQNRISCTYNSKEVRDTCRPYGCVRINQTSLRGFCGLCKTDADCAGATCIKSGKYKGRCKGTPNPSSSQIACKYKTRDVVTLCAPYGCVPTGTTADPRKGSPGKCGLCKNDTHCGSAKCDTKTGECEAIHWKKPKIPEPFHPSFHLLTSSITLNLFDNEVPSGRFLFGVGYMFQRSFAQAQWLKLDGGGWWVRDIPKFYWELGASFSSSELSQNLFLRGGISYQLNTTFTLGFSVLYQRQGSEFWSFDANAKNFNRLGPMVSLGIMNNLFIHASGVWSLKSGASPAPTLLITVEYMFNLINDLVPQRYQKYLPKQMRSQ